MCSWSSAHGSHLWSSHSTLTPYWLSQTPMAWPETYKCFVFTQKQRRIHIVHLLPRPIYTKASKGNSFITNYIHCPKAQAWSPSNVHKTPDFQCSLSLYNNSANCQAQRKILTFSQALPQLTEQPLTISCQDPFHLPLYSSPSHVAQNSSPHQTSWSFFFYPSTNRPFLLFFSPDLCYNSKPTLPIRATPSLIIRRRQSASMPTQ